LTGLDYTLRISVIRRPENPVKLEGDFPVEVPHVKDYRRYPERYDDDRSNSLLINVSVLIDAGYGFAEHLPHATPDNDWG
jgi:hypothetical protein